MNITSLEKCASARAAEPLAPFKMRSLQPIRPSQGGHSPDTYFKLGNILLAPSLSVKTLAPRLPGGCVLAHLVVCILRRRPFSLLRLGNEREHFVGRWSSARRASPPSPFCPLIDSIYSIRGSGEENEPFPPPILRSARALALALIQSVCERKSRRRGPPIVKPVVPRECWCSRRRWPLQCRCCRLSPLPSPVPLRKTVRPTAFRRGTEGEREGSSRAAASDGKHLISSEMLGVVKSQLR